MTVEVINIGKPTMDIFSGNLKIKKLDDGRYQVMTMQLNDGDNSDGVIVTIVEFTPEEMRAIYEAIGKSLL